MRVTAKSEYAVLAMIELANRASEGPVSVRDIAESQGIPSRFLEQVFAALRRAGLVRAVRGAHGGFELGLDASAISILAIVEAVEGSLRSSVCDGARDGACGRSAVCAAGGLWERAGRALKDVFGECTLSQLASEQAALDTRRVREGA